MCSMGRNTLLETGLPSQVQRSSNGESNCKETPKTKYAQEISDEAMTRFPPSFEALREI